MFRKYVKIKLINAVKWIYQFLKKLEIVFDHHKYISGANILSILLGVLPFCYCFLTFKLENKVDGIDFLLPIPFVYLILHFSVSIFEKHPCWSRIVSILSCCLIIIGIQLIDGAEHFKNVVHSNYEYACREYRYYASTVSTMRQDRVGHFPRKVPKNANDVIINNDSNAWFGSESLYLKFKTNKDYIENELKKHKYVKVIKYKDLKRFEYSFYCNGIDLSDYTLYVINDREHENLPEYHFPYHYGIGVNSDKTEILYYYENPD